MVAPWIDQLLLSLSFSCVCEWGWEWWHPDSLRGLGIHHPFWWSESGVVTCPVSLHMWAEDVSGSFSQGYWNHSLPLLYSCEKQSHFPLRINSAPFPHWSPCPHLTSSVPASSHDLLAWPAGPLQVVSNQGTRWFTKVYFAISWPFGTRRHLPGDSVS